MSAIDTMILRRRAVKTKVAVENKDLVLKYVKEYFSDVQDLGSCNALTYELIAASFFSLKIKLRSLDSGCHVTSNWLLDEGGHPIDVKNIKIQWSNEFSKKNNIDKELNLDQLDVFLKT